MMKIAIVAENRNNRNASLGGTYWYIFLLLESLKKHEVTLFLEGELTDDLIAVCRRNNVKYQLISHERPMRAQGFQFSFLWEIYKYFKFDLKYYDLVITSGSSDCRFLGIKILVKKMIMILHSQPKKEFIGLFDWLNKIILRIISKSKNATIYSVCNYGADILSINNIKCKVLHNCSLMDLPSKSKKNVDNYEICKNYILTVGQLIEYKGVYEWLELASKLNALRSDITLVWVGYGPLKSKIEKYKKENNLTNIIIIERCDNLYDLYLNALVYFHPSKLETYSLSLCDAGYLNVPIVCFDNVGDNDVIVKKTNNSLLVNMNNYIEPTIEFIANVKKESRKNRNYNFSIDDFNNRLNEILIKVKNDQCNHNNL